MRVALLTDSAQGEQPQPGQPPLSALESFALQRPVPLSNAMESPETAVAESSSSKKSESKKTFVLKKWVGVALWHFGDDTNSDCGICRSSKQDYCTISYLKSGCVSVFSKNS